MSEEPTPVTQAAKPLAASDTVGDMPDWLKKLRENGDEEEVTPTVEQPSPIPIPIPTPQPAPVSQPQPPVAEVLPTSELEKDRTEDHLPADADERLSLAQTAYTKGDIEEAVRIYNDLIVSGVHLDKIIEDIQQAIRSYPPNHLLFLVMGDAMMKDGRLRSALEAYRTALKLLWENQAIKRVNVLLCRGGDIEIGISN